MNKLKTTLALLLSLLLVFAALPVSIAAADTLYVNGVDILTATDKKVVCGDGYAEYDEESNTLKLTNATIDKYAPYTTKMIDISITKPLTILLVGENKIISDQGAIIINNDLTIKGEGTLYIDCGNNGKVDAAETGISAYGITIDGVEINIEDDSGSAMDGTTITLKNGAKVNTDSVGYGLVSSGDIIIENSTVETKAGDTMSDIYSIEGSVSIINSSITASSGYPAINGKEYVEISNSTLEVSASLDCAIWSPSSVTLTECSGKSLTLTPEEDGSFSFTMPSGNVTVAAEFVIPIVEPNPPEPEKITFDDVLESDWYYSEISYVCENGLMNGIGGNLFAPNATLTRAMVVTTLSRIDGVESLEGDDWYVNGVAWAVENGISDGTMLDANVTREQLVTMFYRYAQYKGVPTTADDCLWAYPDAADVSDWALEAFNWAIDKEMITGRDTGELDPQGEATRAEAAAIIVRYLTPRGLSKH